MQQQTADSHVVVGERDGIESRMPIEQLRQSETSEQQRWRLVGREPTLQSKAAFRQGLREAVAALARPEVALQIAADVADASPSAVGQELNWPLKSGRDEVCYFDQVEDE